MGRFHAQTLQSFADVTITAVSNPTLEKAERLANEVGAKAFQDYREVLDAPVDVVFVCTPDYAHREISIDTLEAGKHLFLEKALATNLEDGRAILACAERHPELKSMVGYPRPFTVHLETMRRIINEESAGRPAMAWSFRSHYLSDDQPAYDKGRDEHYAPPKWYFERAQGKGPVFSHASHDYHALMSLFGPVESVYAAGDTYNLKDGDVADGFFVTLRFANGAVGNVSTPWVSRVSREFGGAVTQNVSVINDNGILRVRRGTETEEAIEFAQNPFWHRMMTHFLQCIEEDREPRVSIADGLRAITVAEAAFQSLHTGGEVRIADLESNG